MAKLTEEQELVWAILSHDYPSEHYCNNCRYSRLGRHARDAWTPRCQHPVYQKTGKTECLQDGVRTRWIWDGKIN